VGGANRSIRVGSIPARDERPRFAEKRVVGFEDLP
jgi:hypothetical protein